LAKIKLHTVLRKGRRKLLRPKIGWEDDIKKGIKEIECDGLDWFIWLSTVVNLEILQNSGIFFTGCETIALSRRSLLLGGS
jgi:hypothetical protein